MATSAFAEFSSLGTSCFSFAKVVDAINDRILDKFPGELKVFQSVDKAIIEEGADQIEAHYSTEYLNSIKASGIPLSELKLKIGCPIMILCNLDPANGAQAILTRFSTHVLEVWLIGGQHAGKLTFILQISLSPPIEAVGFHLTCHQFPVHLAFTMTINKSQGQSVKNVGINFQTPVFTHGQFYVAMSQCTSGSCIKVLFPEDSPNTVTKDIVFPEIILS